MPAAEVAFVEQRDPKGFQEVLTLQMSVLLWHAETHWPGRTHQSCLSRSQRESHAELQDTRAEEIREIGSHVRYQTERELFLVELADYPARPLEGSPGVGRWSTAARKTQQRLIDYQSQSRNSGLGRFDVKPMHQPMHGFERTSGSVALGESRSGERQYVMKRTLTLIVYLRAVCAEAFEVGDVHA